MEKIERQLDDEEWASSYDRRQKDDADAWKDLKAQQQQFNGSVNYS